jgi:protein-S-isoprenylcysteine O-methyltransferase Ste14
MIVGWLLIFPAGIFLARFGRTTFKWFPKHRIVQTFGVLIVFIGMFLGEHRCLSAAVNRG